MNLQSLISNHRTFAVLLVTIVLMELAHGIELIALFPLYLSERMNEGAAAIGITLSSYLVADILIRTPAGALADRWARKPMLILGIVLSAAPLLAMPRVESPALFLALNAINGIGAGCIWPSVYAAIADTYDRARYGVVLGIVNMVMLGGIALGPITGGLLLSRASYETAFAVCLAIVVIALLLVLALMRENPHRENNSDEKFSPRAFIAQFNPTLLRLLAVGFAIALALGMMLPLVSLFGKDVLRVTPDQLALILIPPGIVAAGLIVPAGYFADHYGRYTPLILGLALVAIPFASAPISTNVIIVSVGASVAGIGYALLAPAWNALVMDWIPARARGLFLGVIATAQGVGLALGPTIGGALWERMGVYAPFEIAASLLGVGVVVSVWEARVMKKERGLG